MTDGGQARAAGVDSWIPPGVVWVFLAVVAVATALRLIGLDFGLPYLWHPDEPAIMSRSLRILKTGDLNPGWFHYPSLIIYLHTATSFLGVLDLLEPQGAKALEGVFTGFDTGLHHTISAPETWHSARRLTAVFGGLAAGVTYLAGRKLFGEGAGVVAAIILALAPEHVIHSRYITVDVPASAAVALLLLASAYLLRDGARRHYVFAGLAFGLTISFKYNAVFVLAVPMVAWVLAERHRNERLWWAVSLPPIGFGVLALTMPYAILDLGTVVKDVLYEAHHYAVRGEKRASFERLQGWDHFSTDVGYLVETSLPYWWVLVALGLALGLRKDWRATALVLAGPGAVLFALSGMKVHYVRNLTVVLPGLAVLAGAGAALSWAALVRWQPRARWATPAALLLVAVPGWATFTDSQAREADLDSRVLFTDALQTDAPAGMVLAVPSELRLYAGDLEGLSVVSVTLVDADPADWVRAGATHVVGGPAIALGMAASKARPDPASIAVAAAWFASQKPLFAFGSGRWKVDLFAHHPGIALYALDPSLVPAVEEVPADAEGSADPAAPPPPPTVKKRDWEVAPPRLKKSLTDEGDGVLRLHATDAHENLLVCHRVGTAASKRVTLGGRLRWEGVPKEGAGLRVQVRFFDVNGGLVRGSSVATRGLQNVTTRWGSHDWLAVEQRVRAPPGAATARLCVGLAGQGSQAWLDQLRFTDAR
jgi:4-amino-4-deoxy-L-arabinose transferase-like glycosyltransferase